LRSFVDYFIFGIVSPAAILKEMKKYTLIDGFLEKIKCPVRGDGRGAQHIL
jgi:hypothetical protein